MGGKWSTEKKEKERKNEVAVMVAVVVAVVVMVVVEGKNGIQQEGTEQKEESKNMCWSALCEGT